MARIVIVDDDMDQFSMMAEYLRGLGHEVRAAVDPANLYAVVQDWKPDLALLDMQMPAGGGPSAKLVLDKASGMLEMPIVVCSGMPVAEQKKWFPEAPTRRHIAKPVSLPELRKLIEELLPAGGKS